MNIEPTPIERPHRRRRRPSRPLSVRSRQAGGARGDAEDLADNDEIIAIARGGFVKRLAPQLQRIPLGHGTVALARALDPSEKASSAAKLKPLRGQSFGSKMPCGVYGACLPLTSL